MRIIRVNLKDDAYNIYIKYNLFTDIAKYIKNLNIGNFAYILTSKKIYNLYKREIAKSFDTISHKIITVPDGEKAKSKYWLFYVIDFLSKNEELRKKIYIICLGGGSVGDLGGFIASIYKRGIPYIQVPTTLLSQIDASIGGKTAINLKYAKNILGTFYQPKAVFIDPLFLQTLSKEQLIDGISEAIKYAVIKNKKLFNFLCKNYQKILDLNPEYIVQLISECVKIKAKVVELDEKEKKGIRTILNFGHTFAHALESSFSYKKISHGKAVAIGMVFAAKLSYLLKKCTIDTLRQLLYVIKLYNLPTRIKFNFSSVYKSLVCYDKKFISGNIRMVLINKIGKVQIMESVSPSKIKQCLIDF
ncbi:MAG: 3-dehydroquinate synthase [Candidatus Omnitrophica bacterium]|nr:3-dehydroquinate synthase [Candidatus Omnitrophota bacterium]